jgi:uncharacterized protein (TIGR02145 family)
MKKYILHLILGTAFLLSFSGSLLGQSIIRGFIKSGPEGTPMVGVTLTIIGTSTGAVSDGSGNYYIVVASGSPVTLVATYVGYSPIEKTLTPDPGTNWMNFWFNPPDLPSDFDGNYYDTVNIGTQTWMVENLMTTHFRGGTNIPNVIDNIDWDGLTNPGFCWYDNDYSTYKDLYGALYNWYAVANADNLCPAGWHVPTNSDWTALENYLIANGYNYDGSTTGNKIAKAMAAPYTFWTSGATTGSVGNPDFPEKQNASGFTALPGGSRWTSSNGTGTFGDVGGFGFWWLATQYSGTDGWMRIIAHNNSNTNYGNTNKKMGMSVRCIKNPSPSATISGTITVCKDASSPNITLTGSNGTAPYTFTYAINGGSNLTVTTTTGNSVTVAAPTNIAGTFTYSLVSVQDAYSFVSQTGTVDITINQLPTVNIEAVQNVTCTGCADGAIYVTITEGKPEYIYEWIGPGSYSNTAEDINSLVAGVYNLEVADANGCSASASAEVFNPLMVTNTDDGGMGSLRNAINYANTNSGRDSIIFNIAGSGLHTIQPLSPLPVISEPLVIDGYTQPEAVKATEDAPAILMIELDGRSSISTGLTITGGNSTIKGIIMNGFGEVGLYIIGSADNTIAGNYFGLDSQGQQKDYLNIGIKIDNSSGNTIGGDSPASRNVLIGPHGEANSLIFIDFPGSFYNVVKGNYLGLDPSGYSDLGRAQVGIRINAGAHHNTIGPKNVISNNFLSGIQMEPSDIDISNNNLIVGNYIGTDRDGSDPIPNGNGIRIFGGSNNTIGGSVTEERNIISGNLEYGIYIQNSETFQASNNIVEGNYVGLDESGAKTLGNGKDGIRVDGRDNIIGGSEDGTGNIVSGNGGDGIHIWEKNATGNIIAGNLIGTDASGKLDLGNGSAGVRLNTCVNNTLGGATFGSRNIISGNDIGVVIQGPDDVPEPRLNKVIGNFIGTDITGMNPLSNSQGMFISAAHDNIIGGSVVGERNIVSGNENVGIELIDSATNNIIKGNFIGTDSLGTGSLPNLIGIDLNGSRNNIIGGSEPGAGNIISGNLTSGLSFSGSPESHIISKDNIVYGNYIGLDASGSESLGNGLDGINIVNSLSNIIGGTNSGQRNFISGNGGSGIHLSGSFTRNNYIIGNYIGTDLSGKNPAPNSDGVNIDQEAGKNYIGGSSHSSGNLIAFNTDVGIWLGSDSSLVEGNEIHGHDVDGIFITGNHNVIGGSENGMRNYFHGNNNGIRTDQNANFNRIEGNYLGTDITGEIDQTDGFNGVAISGSDNVVINNLISGYEHHGIYIQRWNNSSPVPERNRLEANIIGLNASATDFIPNQHGISIISSTSNKIIKNIIAGNTSNGIDINDTYQQVPVNNRISENAIYSNGGLGIDLGNDEMTPNDDGDSDTGSNNLQNFPVLESVSFIQGSVTVNGFLNSESYKSFTLQFFASKVGDDSGYGEGQTYIGYDTVRTNYYGNATFSATLPIKSSYGQVITATATSSDGNTSEFSKAIGGLKDQVIGESNWPMHFKYNKEGVVNITNGSDTNAVINSFQTWSVIPTAEIEFINDGPTDAKYANANDGINLVTFVDDQYYLPPGVLAVAAKKYTMDADGTESRIIDADIIVNPDFVNQLTGSLAVGDENGTPGTYDIQSVITHEIGHLMGLLHSGVVNATMFFWLDAGTTEVRSLETDDVAWASYRYQKEPDYSNTYGSISGNITYGYDNSPPVAGALVTATNTATNISVHSYSDASGHYLVPGLIPGSYNVFIEPLDGDVNGYPLKPGNISLYILSNTIYFDYPGEYFNNPDTKDDRGLEIATVAVTPGSESPGINFITDIDLVPPEIISVFPKNDAIDIDIFPDIVITFSEQINEASLSVSTCYLEYPSSDNETVTMGGSFTQMGDYSNVMIFTPEEALDYSTLFTLHIKEITDLRDNLLEEEFISTFKTEAEDGTPPEVTYVIPEDGSDNVFVTDRIIVTFSEAMNKTSVESGFTLSCNGNPDVEGSFSWDDQTNTVTYSPLLSLAEGTLYTITLSGNIEDLQENKMGEVDVLSIFTTVAEANPRVIYRGPENGSTGVSVKTPVVIDFTEPINTSTVNSNTFRLLLGDIKISGSFEFLNDNSRVVFRPDENLEFGNNYTIILTEEIMDVSNPALPLDLEGKPSSSFTTATEPLEPHIDFIEPPTGVSGSTVTIAGRGFDPNPVNNNVAFIDIKATVKNATLTGLVVEVPKGVLSGLVTVTVNGVTSNGFYFYIIPQSLDPCEEVIANIKTGTKTRDVDVTPDGATAYVTNAMSNTVSVIDISETNEYGDPISVVGDPIPVGKTPLKIDINPQGTKAYVTNFTSNTVSVIDLITNTVIKTINVGINPYGIVVTPDGEWVYVANYTSNDLSVIDLDPSSGGFDHVVANVKTGTRNSDIAVSPDAGLVFVAGDNGLTIVNSNPDDDDYNSVVANVRTGTKTRDVDVSPDAGFAFVTTEDGELLVIDVLPESDFFGAVVANASAGTRIRDVSTSGDGLHIYVTTENNEVLVFEIGPAGSTDPNGSYAAGYSLTLHETIPMVGNEGLVIDAKNERLLVVNSGTENGSGELTVIKICCGPVSPENAIGNLIITIQSLINNGTITESTGDDLIKKLNDALRNLYRDKTKTAINDLGAFINKVKARIKSRDIPSVQGIALIDGANAIIAQLKGTKSDVTELYNYDYENQPGLEVIISESKLGAIYPNPFSESITINYEIAESNEKPDNVLIKIYDISGRLVGTLVDAPLQAGRYSTVWKGIYDNGKTVPYGIYFVLFRTGNVAAVSEIMLTR